MQLDETSMSQGDVANHDVDRMVDNGMEHDDIA